MNIEKYMTKDRWRDAGPFRLDLDFKSVTAVRGVARATFDDQDGHAHDVLIPDFADMIPHMVGGKISGEFKIQKRGERKYGLKLWGLRGDIDNPCARLGHVWVDDGECNEGCCDLYVCGKCGEKKRVEYDGQLNDHGQDKARA